MTTFNCRFCETPLTHTFIDLGLSPLANAYIQPGRAIAMEPFYPLHAYVCHTCFLVQLGEFESPEHIFSEYAYFSSFSDSWLNHCRDYVDGIVARLELTSDHKVVEVASNDGYLLQYFLPHSVPVLGVEPAANVAKAAEERGVKTHVGFFGTQCAEGLVASGQAADLLIANNVLAHVPNLKDFVAGIQKMLKPEGVATLEFPHLLQLMRHTQFDTIYHEHFSYFSFLTVEKIFESAGLRVFDVDQLPTHGGSLRLYVCQQDSLKYSVNPAVFQLRQQEERAGLHRLETYTQFAPKVHQVRNRLLKFLISAQESGKTVVGYGAPAKGNTLLNYCGVKSDLIAYTVDKNPYKQGCLLPGTHIPIESPDKIRETRPDYVLILPWNLEAEIRENLAFITDWGGEFVLSIPQLEPIA